MPLAPGKATLDAAPLRAADGARILDEMGYSAEQIKTLARDRVIALPSTGAPSQIE